MVQGVNMLVPSWLPVYGDTTYRGECPLECAEHITLFSWIRKTYPNTLALIALHPKNEGKRSYQQDARELEFGLCRGAPDLLIPGSPSLALELKRRDMTKSALSEHQLRYLLAAKHHGSAVAVALGFEAAKQVVQEFFELR